MVNLYNNKEKINSNQSIYNSYNDWIMSSDRNVFNKLYSKFMFYEMTKNLHGDIVECGVFKGSGMLSWLKIKHMNEPNSIKKVLGFDFFNPGFVETLQDPIDKSAMRQVFERVKGLDLTDISHDGVEKKILSAGFNSSDYDLIQGDITETSNDYVKSNPGFRISILNLDLDLDEPTYSTLTNLWDRVVPGGIVIFDEYAYHSWSESNAVDRFINEKNLDLIKLNIKTPTAYIVK